VSDYTQSTFFAPKDLLATGNPNKIIYGSDVDAELSAISTAIATKADVNGDAIGAGTPCTELSVDNLKLDGNKITSTNTDGDIELEPDGTGIVTISSSVGIGTTSPANLLHVKGASAGALEMARFRLEGATNNPMLKIEADEANQTAGLDVSGSTATELTFSVGGTERARIDGSGNFGIGTVSPARPLEVNGAIRLANANGIEWGGSNYSIVGDTAGALIFNTAGSEVARFDGSGNLGIGTGTPSFATGTGLEIQRTAATATVRLEYTGSNAFELSAEQNTVTYNSVSSKPHVFEIGSSEKMRLDASGSLTVAEGDTTFNGSGFFKHVGTYSRTTASAANLFIFTDGQFYRSTSSARYKHSIEDAPYGLSDLMSLRAVTYKGNNDGDTVYGGLVAEEVHDAGLGEFVQYDEQGRPDALAYGNMVSLCIKAIQEQQEIIEDLRARLAALEA
jgi:hypothetical protein